MGSSCVVCGMSLSLLSARQRQQHVNACLDGPTPTRLPSGGLAEDPDDLNSAVCGICDIWLGRMTLRERTAHVNSCLDGTGRTPAANSGANTIEKRRAVARGDPTLAIWLASLGLRKYEHLFAVQEVDFQTLPLLDESDLEKMKLPEKPRGRIFKEIRWARIWALGNPRPLSNQPCHTKRRPRKPSRLQRQVRASGLWASAALPPDFASATPFTASL